MTTTYTRSEIFTVYNFARHAARLGKLDQGRVNRALGLVLSGERRPYLTSVAGCTCPDSRNHVCKHRIAKMIEYRIQEARKKQAEEEEAIPYLMADYDRASHGE